MTRDCARVFAEQGLRERAEVFIILLLADRSGIKRSSFLYLVLC